MPAAELRNPCATPGGCAELAAERLERSRRDDELLAEVRSVRSEVRRLRPWLRTVLTITIPVLLDKLPAIIQALK
jgi:hypothetical protein